MLIAELAARQHGIVTRAQLIRAGMAPHVVDFRVKTGRLVRMHTGVYRVGPVVADRAREMAAALACSAVVSHRTAAAIWTMLPAPPAFVEVTATAGPRRRPGIVSHRARLARDEVTRIGPLPITTLARTVLDVSRVVHARDLERAWARAERIRPGVRAEVGLLLRRYAGQAGTGALRRVIAAPAGFTRSEAETRMLRLIRAAGLPEPAVNVSVHRFEVDFFWSDARLVVEVDGYAFHGSRRAFERDRRRDAALAAAGVRVVRLSWQQIVAERVRTVAQIAQALARGGV